MAKPDGTLVFVGTYPDEASARWDYDAVKALHDEGAIGTGGGPHFGSGLTTGIPAAAQRCDVTA